MARKVSDAYRQFDAPVLRLHKSLGVAMRSHAESAGISGPMLFRSTSAFLQGSRKLECFFQSLDAQGLCMAVRCPKSE